MYYAAFYDAGGDLIPASQIGDLWSDSVNIADTGILYNMPEGTESVAIYIWERSDVNVWDESEALAVSEYTPKLTITEEAPLLSVAALDAETVSGTQEFTVTLAGNAAFNTDQGHEYRLSFEYTDDSVTYTVSLPNPTLESGDTEAVFTYNELNVPSNFVLYELYDGDVNGGDGSAAITLAKQNID